MEKIRNYKAVNKLGTILNYQLASPLLFLLYLVSGLFLTLIALAALIFSIYLIYVLFGEKRYGWIVSFFAVVVLPFAAAISPIIGGVYSYVLLLVSLLFFFVYCFILRMSVQDWLREYRQSLLLAQRKKQKEMDDRIWEMQFKKPKDG